MNYTTRPIFKYFFSNFVAVLHYSDSIDKLNELNSCEIRRLNIDVAFGVVAVAADCFCYLDSERLPALSTICLFGCLACVWALFALHSFVYSFLCRSFSCYCLCKGHPSQSYLNSW